MRLFIGLPLSDHAARSTALLASAAREHIPGRYSLESNYHLTLAFLGETPFDRLNDAKAVLREFAAHFPAPRLVLGGLSFFRQPANAILIRSADSPDDLSAMHSELCTLLQARELPCTDGPYSPHVTLARHADMSNAPTALLSAKQCAFTAPHAVLYLSARDHEQVLRYTPLERAAFTGRQA